MTIRFGEAIKVELYGTSHGPCIGVRIEGLPAGRIIDTDRLQAFLDRRAPGRNAWSTARKEADQPVFLSGVEEVCPEEDRQEPLDAAGEQAKASGEPVKISGEPAVSTGDSSDFSGILLITNGEPLAAEIRNTNVRPADYKHGDHEAVIPRPGHADYPAWVKYGQIESGGGPFSARLTAALCIAGGIFLQWLEESGITVSTHIRSIGFIEDAAFDPMAESLFVIDEAFPVIDQRQGDAMKELIAETKAAGDSIGGSIECMIRGLPAGIGTPLFGSIESRLCQTIFAVPAVKGIEFGAGFDVTRMKGSENNDPFEIAENTLEGKNPESVDDGTSESGDECALEGAAVRASTCAAGDEVRHKVRTVTNHHGGILGGLSSGMPILLRVAMKPTPSIVQPQQSVDLASMTPTTLEIKGRHDPCIVPRAVPCIEAAAALAIGDLLLEEGKL